MKISQKRINNFQHESEDDIEFNPHKRHKVNLYNKVNLCNKVNLYKCDNLTQNIDDSCYNDDIDNIQCMSKTCTHDKNNSNCNIKKTLKIESIKDLIQLANEYNCISCKSYNGINLRILNNLIEPLNELDNMIGLTHLKDKFINQLMYICRGYNSIPCNNCIDCKYNIPCCSNSKEMLHTVITGPPGVGKTEFARILAKIYTRCGFVKNDKLIEVTRKDLISGYLGRTAKKTAKIFKKAKNGVIFIDEVYSLGNTGDEDSYSKECIDIINKQLSENTDIIVIIAGYKEQIDNCFFRVNPGLERRFPFKYEINGYSGDELFKILEQKIINDNWKIQQNEYEKIKKYIISKHKTFNNFAGDMTTLLMKGKIKNSRNINSTNYILTYDDFIIN